MLQFEDFTQNYLSDSQGKLYLDSNLVNIEKSKLRESITLDECKSILGRKYKICLYRMLPLCSYILSHHNSSFLQLSSTFNYNIYYKHIFNNNISNIPLCNTFKNELEQTDDARKMSNNRAIQNLQKLGIIKCVSNFKHFNDVHHNNIAYAYVFSTSCIYSLLSILSLSFKYHYNNIINIPLCNTFEKEDNEDDKHIKHSKLYEKYLPLLNYELERQTVQGDFRYHLKENGSRPYAYFCSSEHKKSNERNEMLNNYFGKGKWQQWDRSASVFNLTYSYNTKKYLPNSIDLHAKMNGRSFENEEEREIFKVLNMTKLFSDGRKVRKLLEKMTELQNKKNDNIALTKKEITFYKNNVKRANALCKLAKKNNISDIVKYFIKKRNEMIKTIGNKKIDNDAIFIMEGVVNLATMNDLNDLGYKTVSVYDGFYTECFDNELIESIYKNNITKYIIGE